LFEDGCGLRHRRQGARPCAIRGRPDMSSATPTSA
jgi:hypothetical protein